MYSESLFLLGMRRRCHVFVTVFQESRRPGKKNYSRLSIISDFHYPCKKLVTPKERLRYMAAKEGALQDMNDWRDLDLAVFTGDMVQRNGSAEEYRLVRLVVNGLKSGKPSLPAIMNCSIRATARISGPAAVPNESCTLPATPRPSGRSIMPKNSGAISWYSCRRTRLPAALPSNYLTNS